MLMNDWMWKNGKLLSRETKWEITIYCEMEDEKRWEKKRLARRTNRLTERGSNENGDDNPKEEMNWSFTRENSVTHRTIQRGWLAMRCPSGDSKNGYLPLFSWLCYSSKRLQLGCLVTKISITWGCNFRCLKFFLLHCLLSKYKGYLLNTYTQKDHF